MGIVIDLCTGIGGLTLGYMAHGYQPAVFSEQNSYCQQVLKARFGDIPLIPNIQDVTAIALQSHGVRSIDGIVAGLPCPAFSVAGKRKASQDERNLFPQFFRIVREVCPQWFVIENVPGLLTAENGKFFAGVLREIAASGFDAEWGIVSAASVGAVHLRERIFIIAHAYSQGRIQGKWERTSTINNFPSHSQSRASSQLLGCDRFPQTGSNLASIICGDDGDTGGNRCKQQLSQADQGGKNSFLGSGLLVNPVLKSEFCHRDDGLSAELDRHLLRHEQLADWLDAATIPRVNRLSAAQVAVLSPIERSAYRECWAEYQQIRRQHKEAIAALGNAVVPQVAAKIFQRLKKIL